MTAPAVAARPLRTDWIAAGIVVACGVVTALQVGKGVITLPALRTEFGLGLEAAGWVLSVFAVLGVVGGIPAGAAVSRFGDRRLLALGLLALAVGGLVGALAGSFALLLGARVVEGLGFLLVSVAAPALLQRIAAAGDRDLAFGIWSAYMPAGMAIALLLGAALAGWRPFWVANAVLAAAFVLLLLLLVPRGTAAALSWRAAGRDAVLTVTSSGPLLLAASFTLYNVMYFALVGFLPVLLAERMGVSVAVAGALSAVAVGANVLGNLAAGLLLGRGTARWALVAAACAVMALSGVAIFWLALPPTAVFLLCVLFSGVAGLLPASVIGGASLAAPRPDLGPMVVGLVMQGSALGQVVAPVVVGGAVDAAGWPAAAIPVAVAGLIGIAVAVRLRRVFLI
ncbi:MULTISPECIES: MFS transporter [Inquilinus]|uniref:MFS family arabinose efflux permease n=1 Tax=Inquilinus ginsengisoli TaxID=363840 RepID=A0ABU1JTK7_9PROT|nr:MFS transporter [Inquilinus ginsengisoli]MDR6291948.1 putative MFS family arabinose efflux permease [Inquilinus ginsengisoli]